jgi:CRP-like cAMP-binding protein
MDSQLEKEIAANVRELLNWVKIQAMPAAKTALESALPEPHQRKLYQALDGTLSQVQLAKMFETSQPTVSRLLSAWHRAGIVEEVSSGRFAKLFDLRALGVPENIGGKEQNGR